MNRILVVRHGESESNANPEVMIQKPDVAIELTNKGKLQASDSGYFISEYINKYKQYKNVIVHSSTYQRASNTADIIKDIISNKCNVKVERTYSDYLVEIIQGNFIYMHGKGMEYYQKHFPFDFENWRIQCTDKKGIYFARRPNGESYFDVSCRIKDEIIKAKEASKTNSCLFIVVAHGLTNRCFAKESLNKDVDWFLDLDNPFNCEVWELDFNKDELNSLYIP